MRLFKLRAELQAFFTDNSLSMKVRLRNQIWLFRLSFMADIFQKLNELNLSLQGKQTTVFQACNKMTAFKEKLIFRLFVSVREKSKTLHHSVRLLSLMI